jgi:hypothetical protein
MTNDGIAEAGDVIIMKTFCWRAPQLGLNIRHWKIISSTGGGVAMQFIADSIDALMGPLLRSLLHNSASYKGLTLQTTLVNEPDPLEYFAKAGEGAGVTVGQALPPQICGLLSLRTRVVGRAQRGRMYVPFPGEDDSGQNGGPNLDYIDRLVTLGQFLTSSLNISTGTGLVNLEPVIYHRKDGTVTILNKSLARSSWATQRRRGDFGRVNTLPPWATP